MCSQNMKASRLNVRISESRMNKLRRIASQKEKTMTQLIEDWIDGLKEESQIELQNKI